jgi:hypothetical protein
MSFVIGFAVAAAPGLTRASVIGSLGNFDVINHTGSTAHGFEIELEDLHSSDVSDVFGGPGRGFPTGRGFNPATAVERYGAPTITEYTSGSVFGVRITYSGIFDGMNWDFGTPSGAIATPGDNCWTGGGLGYGPGTPCDHFGVGTTRAPTRTNYGWLVETATPGDLAKVAVDNVPAPVWQAIPDPVMPDAPPQIVARIEAPEPEIADQFGEAIWVKVYTTEIEQEVELEDLIAGNPVIDQSETEIEWQLLQKDPRNPLAGVLENGHGAPVGDNSKSIVRRYEFFAYTGIYSDEDHEALVLSDSNPQPGEVGDYLGAQNAAAILGAPVPLPPAVWLLGSSLIGIALRRRPHR